jgi:histidine triad (HIT) family protein
MADCIFCRIAAGQIPCHELFQNEHLIAFLDAAPLARGHALVVPRQHARCLAELPEAAAAELGRALHLLIPALEAQVGAPAALVALHDGREAGQEVPHVHWHVVPRKNGDGAGPIHALFHQRPQLDEARQSALAASVRETLRR